MSVQIYAPKAAKFDGMAMRAKVTQDKWLQRCAKRGALWCHDGHKDRPHALLTGGSHTDRYFNIGVVGEDPRLLSDAASDLVDMLEDRGLKLDTVDRVIGPAMGAITLADAVARHISKTRHKDAASCLAGYTEKVVLRKYDHDVKVMILSRLKLKAKERVLVVDDVRSGGHTVDLTAQAVREAGGTVLPYRGMLVNRSGEQRVDGVEIVSLINRQFPMYEWDHCQLCKAGSEAIRPKEVGNWERLTKNY